MAEKPAQEKTEKPTAQRIRKAREEGMIPQSKELPSALILTVLLLTLALTATGLYTFFVTQARQGMSLAVGSAGDISGYRSLFRQKVTCSLWMIAPFMATGVGASLFASVLVGGWTYAPSAVKLKIGRLNPISGLRGLFSMKSVVNLLVSLAKLAVLLGIVWYYLRGKLEVCVGLRWQTPEGVMAGIAELVFGLAVRIAVGVMAIAGLDWLYQRWHYQRQLRMTKQEVKQEQKDREISPNVKGRIRGIQIELARKRMLQEVPTADVVLTNPTHVAVALKYEAGEMEAPVVVAKGPDLLCEKIKEIARAHNVPIVQRPELARTIYRTVELGQAIPEALFVAVAEVLAMIYRARRQRSNTAQSSKI